MKKGAWAGKGGIVSGKKEEKMINRVRSKIMTFGTAFWGFCP